MRDVGDVQDIAALEAGAALVEPDVAMETGPAWHGARRNKSIAGCECVLKWPPQ